MLIPDECPICGVRMTAHSSPVCPACRGSLLSESALAPVSSGHIPAIWSCLPYSGVLRECIKQFKYHGRKRMTRVFFDLAGEYLAEKPVPVDIIDSLIPVPICSARLRERRFNQSELIAGILCRLVSKPVCVHNLTKSENTPPQNGLSRNRRIDNLKGSFFTRDPAAMRDKTILLVDDVMTTGATLETCAEELLRAGAKKVLGFTLARTL